MIKKALIGLAVAAAGALAAGGTYVYNNLLYDKDGYNKHGFDKDGYDRDGYDKDGYDRKGFDKDGFDCEGYDHEGFDKSGFNRFGVDREGYNRNGFDSEGYDRSGKDRQGYYKSGYNSEGLDRGGKSFDYYNDELQKIEDILKKAHGQMKSGEFGYALHDIRIGLEKGVKCIIIHWRGDSDIKKNLMTTLPSARIIRYSPETLSRNYMMPRITVTLYSMIQMFKKTMDKFTLHTKCLKN